MPNNKPSLRLRHELQTVMQNAIKGVLDDYSRLFTAAEPSPTSPPSPPSAAVEPFEPSPEPSPETAKATKASQASKQAASVIRHKDAKAILSHLELLLKLHETYCHKQELSENDEHRKRHLIDEARQSLRDNESD